MVSRVRRYVTVCLCGELAATACSPAWLYGMATHCCSALLSPPCLCCSRPSPHGTTGEGIQLLASCHPFRPRGAEPKCQLRSPSVKSLLEGSAGSAGQGQSKTTKPDTGTAFGRKEPSADHLDES